MKGRNRLGAISKEHVMNLDRALWPSHTQLPSLCCRISQFNNPAVIKCIGYSCCYTRLAFEGIVRRTEKAWHVGAIRRGSANLRNMWWNFQGLCNKGCWWAHFSGTNKLLKEIITLFIFQLGEPNQYAANCGNLTGTDISLSVLTCGKFCLCDFTSQPSHGILIWRKKYKYQMECIAPQSGPVLWLWMQRWQAASDLFSLNIWIIEP